MGINDTGLASFRDPVDKVFDYAALRACGALPSRFAQPVFALWDLTYRCTLACSYCYNNSGAGAERGVGRSAALEIARQLGQTGVLSVCMSGGDALLHPALFDCARALRSSGVSVSTITNGWLVSDRMAVRMAELFAGVEVSLDGATAETHDALRGRTGSYERALQAIKRLTGLGVRVTVAFTVTLRNLPEFPTMVAMLSEIEGVERVATGYIIPTGKAYGNAGLPTFEQQEEFRKAVKELDQRYSPGMRVTFVDPLWSSAKLITQQLPNPFLHITANGDVLAAQWIPVVFGNVLQEGLATVWKRASGAWQDPMVQRYVREHCSGRFALPHDRVPWIDPFIRYSELESEEEYNHVQVDSDRTADGAPPCGESGVAPGE